MLGKLDLSIIPNSAKKSTNDRSNSHIFQNFASSIDTLSNRPKKNKNVSPIKKLVKNPNANLNSVNFNNLDTSQQSNASNILKFLNEYNETDPRIIPFEDYGNLISETMSKYQTERLEGSKLITLNDQNEPQLTLHEETMIKSIFRSQSMGKSRGVYGTTEDSVMKVSIMNPEYKNPFESFKSLKKNKKIFEEVSGSFLQRQEQVYNDAIDKFNKETMKFKVKMPKIKVTTVMPKMIYDFHKNKKETERKSAKREKNKISSVNEALMIQGQIISDNDPTLFAFYKYSHKNFPEGREQFAFHSNVNNIILWGGIASNKNVDVWSLNPESLEWNKIQADNFYPPNFRYGHSGILFEKKFYVFGGKSKNNNYPYLADLEIFNQEDHLWSSPILNTSTSLKLRKNHVAELIGHIMIIHGGMTDNNECLNDTHILSFQPLKWVHCNISEETPGPALAGHACALVMPSDIKYNPRFNIYKFPDLGIGKFNSSKIKEKGWYIFGGKSREEGGLSNELWILRIGKKPLEWFKPETTGSPPAPRYLHSLNFYEEGNYIIVHGGRNDLSSDSFALNDTYVLDLNKFIWTQVKILSDSPSFSVYNRCGHSAVVFTNKLLVFGGMNNNNYLGSSLFVVHLDLNTRPVLETEEEKVVHLLEKNIKSLGHEGMERLKRLKKKALRRELSIIDEIILPPIK